MLTVLVFLVSWQARSQREEALWKDVPRTHRVYGAVERLANHNVAARLRSNRRDSASRDDTLTRYEFVVLLDCLRPKRQRESMNLPSQDITDLRILFDEFGRDLELLGDSQPTAKRPRSICGAMDVDEIRRRLKQAAPSRK